MPFKFYLYFSSESLSDRFFTALYRKLLDPIPPSAYNQLLLLVYKAMKMDSSSGREKDYIFIIFGIIFILAHQLDDFLKFILIILN